MRARRTAIVAHTIPLLAASDSGIIPVGKSIFFETGHSEQSAPAGVWSYTALG